MEIKIKDKDQLIDATIEVIDGVMIVSPKEEKYEPKDGDVVIIDSLYPCIGIVRDSYSYGKLDTDRLYFSVGYWIESESVELKPFCACNRNTQPNYRPATEEEKKKLFDKLKEEGYVFDFEKKELVKLRWKPKYDEEYWCPSWLYSDGVVPFPTQWSNSKTDNIYQNKGWVFQTEEECEEFCKKLNKAIEGVKP